MKITSRAQAIERVTAEDQREMATLIERIEEALLRYDGNTVSVTPAATKRTNDRVAEQYRSAGWTVDFGIDRDGGWMTLQ